MTGHVVQTPVNVSETLRTDVALQKKGTIIPALYAKGRGKTDNEVPVMGVFISQDVWDSLPEGMFVSRTIPKGRVSRHIRNDVLKHSLNDTFAIQVKNTKTDRDFHYLSLAAFQRVLREKTIPVKLPLDIESHLSFSRMKLDKRADVTPAYSSERPVESAPATLPDENRPEKEDRIIGLEQPDPISDHNMPDFDDVDDKLISAFKTAVQQSRTVEIGLPNGKKLVMSANTDLIQQRKQRATIDMQGIPQFDAPDTFGEGRLQALKDSYDSIKSGIESAVINDNKTQMKILVATMATDPRAKKLDF